MRFKVLRVCQSNALSVVPQEVVRFDLDKAAEVLGEAGYLVTHSDVLVIASKDGKEITLYTNGRLMMHPVEGRDAAATLADEFYARIEEAKLK
jgi:ArsR family metal-binding transcriptional regulator